MRLRKRRQTDQLTEAEHNLADEIAPVLNATGEVLIHYVWTRDNYREFGLNTPMTVSQLMPPAWIAACTTQGCSWGDGSVFDRLTDCLSAVNGHRHEGHQASCYPMFDDRTS